VAECYYPIWDILQFCEGNDLFAGLAGGQSRTVLETIGYKDPLIESGDILSINVTTIDPTTSEAINQSMIIPAIGYSSSNSSVSSQQVISGFPVDEEGDITMNYTGRINVGGLTLSSGKRKGGDRSRQILQECSGEYRLYQL
jgi:polysaccharide export outer membrane protein